MSQQLFVLLMALLAAACGAFVIPAVVRSLPEPVPDVERTDSADSAASDASSADPDTAEASTPTARQWPTYRQVASSRRAPVVLAIIMSTLWVVPLVYALDVGGNSTYLAYAWATVVGLALGWVDLFTHRLPNRLNLAMLGGLVIALTTAVFTGSQDWSDLGRAWAGAAALFAFYFVLAFIYPAGMGMGDVKLAAPLGMFLAWLGWGNLFVGAFLGFLIGAVVGVLGLLTRRASLKTALPFGPSMLVGALIGSWFGGQIFDWYLGR